MGGGAASENRPWRALVLLCALFALSFLDRMVLALVVDPVRASLGVTDNQISLLFGLGFVVVYVVCGFPAAQLVDGGRRKQVLIGGVLLWSTATFVSGFSPNYAMLAVCRAGVAIGEAVLMPAAMSYISDLFPRERRSLPTTIYTLTGVMMGAGSFIVGAGALRLAEVLAPSFGVEPWRIMFAIVAVPGPILALLFAALVRVPQRVNAEPGGPSASLGEFATHFRARSDLYLPIFIGVGCAAAIAFGMSAWGPTLLVREHGVASTSAGLFFGAFAILGALVAMIVVTPLVRALGPKSRAQGVLHAAILVNLTVLPFQAVVVGLSDTRLMLVGLALGTCGSIAAATFAPIVMQAVTPARFVGRVSAVFLTFNNVLGMGMGPLLVSNLASRTEGPGAIGRALSTVAFSAIAIGLACWLFALWRLRSAAPPGEGAASPSVQPG